MDSFGEQLVLKTLGACLLSLPSYFVPSFADVMFALLCMDRERVSEIARGFFERELKGRERESEDVMALFPTLVGAHHAKSVAQNLRQVHRLILR